MGLKRKNNHDDMQQRNVNRPVTDPDRYSVCAVSFLHVNTRKCAAPVRQMVVVSSKVV